MEYLWKTLISPSCEKVTTYLRATTSDSYIGFQTHVRAYFRPEATFCIGRVAVHIFTTAGAGVGSINKWMAKGEAPVL
jgi:hypothetical protein